MRDNSRNVCQRPIVATEGDLLAIEEGLNYLWRDELDFIFSERSRLECTLVLSFDDSTLFVWRRESGTYRRHSFALKCNTEEFSHDWWASGAVVKELEKSLPSEWRESSVPLSFISGALLTPFIEGQKARSRSNNPYTTYESYLATIVHEFGHIYFNKTTSVDNLWDASEALSRQALDAYLGHDLEQELRIPKFDARTWSEIFAFCTDRTASTIFWTAHKEDVDRANCELLRKLLSNIEIQNQYWDRPLIDDTHMAAMIVGPLLMKKVGNDWPRCILDMGYNN